MNLLVTNTRAAQAYSVIQALRPYANKIVATIYGSNFLAAWLSSHAAHSRFVDKYYHAPSFAGDWTRGKITKENTPKEQAYIDEVSRICKTEQIDTIFPSWDAQIFVFSKNKRHFEKLGVFIPIPDYEAWVTVLDKYRALRMAEEAGFPCPRTYLPHSFDDVSMIAKKIKFPVTVKPRFVSWGTEIATNSSELLEKTSNITRSYGTPIIQEFMPSCLRQDLHFLIDKGGELKLAFHRKVERSLRLDLHAHMSTVNELTGFQPFHAQTMAFLENLRKCGWWGSGIIETAGDPHDGKVKFMELVPRFRRQLWNSTELGINEPQMCISIAQGEPVQAVKSYPAGTLFLSPIEDALVLLFQILDLLVYHCRRILGLTTVDPQSLPLPLKEITRSFTRSYCSKRPKIMDPYFRYFFRDPLVSVLWWLQLYFWIIKLARRLGR